LPGLARIEQPAEHVTVEDRGVAVRLADGRTVRARLAVGADGRRSLCRSAAGIETETSSYPQAALTLNFAHGPPHDGISTALHTQPGPSPVVPLPSGRSSLVCVVEPAEAERLAAMDASALSCEIERRAHSILGKVAVEGERGMFRLSVETAKSFAANRIALI